MGFLNNFIQWIVLFLVAVAITITLLILSRRWKELPEIEKDTKVINLIGEFSNGHANGILKDTQHLKNGLTKVTFYPTDLSREQIEQQQITPQTIIAKNVIPMAKGTLSGYVNQLWILPNNITELKNKLPMEIEKEFKAEIIKRKVYDNVGLFMEEKDKATVEAIKEIAGADLQKLAQEKTKEVWADIDKLIQEKKQKEELK